MRPSLDQREMNQMLLRNKKAEKTMRPGQILFLWKHRVVLARPELHLTVCKITISYQRAKIVASFLLPMNFNVPEILLLPLEGAEMSDFIRHLKFCFRVYFSNLVNFGSVPSVCVCLDKY